MYGGCTERLYIPVPQKGDPSKVENYRGVTLTCIAAKIYNTILRKRIQPEIDTVLRPNQNGFRMSRSSMVNLTTEQS